MNKKDCKDCIDFKKLKAFKELRVVFHNWCSHSDVPCALISNCQKIMQFNDSLEFQNEFQRVCEELGKTNPARFAKI